MTEAEKIQGKKMIRLMELVQREKIMLSMRFVGQNYERLTMVTRIPNDDKASFFAIDPPRDFKNTITKLDTWEIHFNFYGPDNLEYIFTTSGGKFYDNEIQINFPDYIERLQRRRYFRISVPTGTKLFFESDQLQREINLINISMRGTLGLLKTFYEKDQKKPVLKKEDYLKNIKIIFPSDTKDNEQEVKINKTIIRRAEHNPQKNMDLYAIEFLSIDRDQEKTLIQIIFNLQRLILQKK
jgi:c-di-GMP-binding flagellar brake protein YcgR